MLAVGLNTQWTSIESVEAIFRWPTRRAHSRNCGGSEVSVPTNIVVLINQWYQCWKNDISLACSVFGSLGQDTYLHIELLAMIVFKMAKI